MNFGGLKGCDLPDKSPRFSVLCAPYDRTATYVSGTSRGPEAIIEASAHMELYDEELKSEPYRAGIETLPPLEVASLSPAGMVERVRGASAKVIGSGSMPVLLGGEHSVTLGLVQALSESHPALSVLHLDAHADMRESYNSSPFNHACVARRISEICPVVSAGIRSMSAEEAEFLETATEIRTHHAAELLETREYGAIVEGLAEEVFITIDLDVFDPSVMPSTGTPEPGGLLWADVTALVRETIRRRRVVGFDVVELCPAPGLVAPDFMAARLVYRMMGYINEKSGC